MCALMLGTTNRRADMNVNWLEDCINSVQDMEEEPENGYVMAASVFVFRSVALRLQVF
jgi:hypothetical protein